MTLAIARLNVSGENRSGWLNDAGDPHLCAKAGVSVLAVHGLRHVSAALGYAATRDAFAVQRRLGHTNVTTTMKIYAYLLRDDTATGVALDKLLSQREGESATPD
jgi:integrase